MDVIYERALEELWTMLSRVFAHIPGIYEAILLIFNSVFPDRMSDSIIEDSDLADIWGLLTDGHGKIDSAIYTDPEYTYIYGYGKCIFTVKIVSKLVLITCIAWASSRRSSSVFMVTNLRTKRFKEAATMAKPNNMNIKANITYSGLLLRALSFCKATMSPKPAMRTKNPKKKRKRIHSINRQNGKQKPNEIDKEQNNK
ncbi:hypothetical protein FF38_05245 [Lucilia cuprina]|uniref:Uncharacterized protein n=1 Tax=Lucilia cuprina TaxID=7375 RepID=A0A0L0CBY8_LUCCU|nr:hypothetical protein FF38_05245 [Lucilia cuprina]